jgi:hypothetical protein
MPERSFKDGYIAGWRWDQEERRCAHHSCLPDPTWRDGYRTGVIRGVRDACDSTNQSAAKLGDIDSILDRDSTESLREADVPTNSVILELIGDQLGGVTEMVVAGFDELCCLLRVFAHRCQAHAFLRKAAVISGAQAPRRHVPGLRLHRICVQTIISTCRVVMHGRANPTDRRQFA